MHQLYAVGKIENESVSCYSGSLAWLKAFSLFKSLGYSLIWTPHAFMLVPLLIGLPEPIIRVSGFLWTSWTSRGELEVSSGGYIYTMEVNQWTLLIRVSPHSRLVVKQVHAHHLDCPYFHTGPNQAISLSSFTPGITRSSPLCPPPFLKVDSLSGFRLNPFPTANQSPKAQPGFSSQFSLSGLWKGYLLVLWSQSTLSFPILWFLGL